MQRYNSLSFITIFACVIAAINAQFLATSVAREGYQMWEPAINSATQVVLDQLNRDKSAANSLHLSKINLEHAKVAQGVVYTVGLEMDMALMKNSRYELSFLQPTSEWQTLWASLPALASHNTPNPAPLSAALALANEHQHHHPHTPSLAMTLRGPLEVYLQDGRSAEVHIKSPREVDVGYVNKISLASGVNISVSGFHELYLREPLSLRGMPTIVDGNLQLAIKETPKVTFVGRHVEISNASFDESLKIKKRGISEIEIASASDRLSHTSSTHMPFEIPVNDSRVQTLQYFLGQLATSSNSQPVVRRLFSAKLEAVTSFHLPLILASATGETSEWDVVVAQGKNSNKVISADRKRAGVEISFDNDIAANGTLAEALQTFLAGHSEYKIVA